MRDKPAIFRIVRFVADPFFRYEFCTMLVLTESPASTPVDEEP